MAQTYLWLSNSLFHSSAASAVQSGSQNPFWKYFQNDHLIDQTLFAQILFEWVVNKQSICPLACLLADRLTDLLSIRLIAYLSVCHKPAFSCAMVCSVMLKRRYNDFILFLTSTLLIAPHDVLVHSSPVRWCFREGHELYRKKKKKIIFCKSLYL